MLKTYSSTGAGSKHLTDDRDHSRCADVLDVLRGLPAAARTCVRWLRGGGQWRVHAVQGAGRRREGRGERVGGANMVI